MTQMGAPINRRGPDNPKGAPDNPIKIFMEQQRDHEGSALALNPEYLVSTPVFVSGHYAKVIEFMYFIFSFVYQGMRVRVYLFASNHVPVNVTIFSAIQIAVGGPQYNRCHTKTNNL